MIKLITIDLDGTLLNNQRQISETNKAAIKNAVDKGVYVVLCSGRPIKGIEAFLQELDLIGPNQYCITYNGGLVQVTGTKEVISQETLSLEEVKEIYALSQDLNLPMNYIDLENVYVPTPPEGRPSGYQSVMNLLPFIEKEVTEFDDDHTFQKAVYCYQEETLDQELVNIPDAFRQKYSLMKSRPVLFEIMPKGVNKATGIAALMTHLNIDQSEVMAIGDEENDLAMIEFAGVGVAMANATDAVKALADFITHSNEDDGVAHAITHYVL